MRSYALTRINKKLMNFDLEIFLEIAIIDGVRRFGNGMALPAGPLREPRSRLDSVDLLVCNGGRPGAGGEDIDLVGGPDANDRLLIFGSNFFAPVTVRLTGCDITDQDQVKATVAATVDQHGKLNALCNIAGALRFDNTLEVNMDDFDQIMRINCYGTFMMCQAAIPHLLETRGFIVNMASTAALGAHAWTAAYSSSKGAVLALTKCLAVEYHLEGLNCNAICPAGVDTPMIAEAADHLPKGADMRLLTKVMSLDGSFAPATDVAGAVAFLACEDANFINGDYIRTDGGLLT